MPEIQTVILNIDAASKKDGTPIVSKTGARLQKMKVDAYSEAVAIWDPGLAQLASSYIGKQVVCDIGSKPTGDYQNYTLYAIRLDGDGSVTLEPNRVAPVSETPQAARGTTNSGGMDEATVQRITRLSCLSSAATFFSGPNADEVTGADVIGLAEVFYRYAFEGR